jgi:hypothetical protein
MKLSNTVVEECIEQFQKNTPLLGLVIPEESFGE